MIDAFTIPPLIFRRCLSQLLFLKMLWHFSPAFFSRHFDSLWHNSGINAPPRRFATPFLTNFITRHFGPYFA
jgi:hypothetical protein